MIGDQVIGLVDRHPDEILGGVSRDADGRFHVLGSIEAVEVCRRLMRHHRSQLAARGMEVGEMQVQDAGEGEDSGAGPNEDAFEDPSVESGRVHAESKRFAPREDPAVRRGVGYHISDRAPHISSMPADDPAFQTPVLGLIWLTYARSYPGLEVQP